MQLDKEFIKSIRDAFLIVLVIFLVCMINGCSTTEKKIDVKSEIFKIVENSSCSKYYWKDRGRAPMSYLKGMGLMYAKQVCGGSDFIRQEKITGNNSIQKMKDALEFYGIPGSELNTYTFLLGLGMRESTGRYCLGRDSTADYVKDYEAEAGLFQTAYVARLFNEELSPLYEAYKNGKHSCELETFSEGVTCPSRSAKNWGNGPGVAWQDFTKKCPAFATDWAAILIRSNYRHFGPIKNNKVEFINECKAMFQEVEKVATDNCGGLE